MAQYVAFLRGINLGRRTVKMDALRAAFADLGFPGASTLIASGNVLFEADSPPDAAALEAGLEERFGFAIGVVIRRLETLRDMIASDPFAGVDPDADVKLYVTLAAGPLGDRLADPGNEPDDFEIIRIDERDWFAIAHKKPDGRYGAGMNRLERRFTDLTITSRNFNTVRRMVAKADQTRQSSTPAKD